jgi:hypothetical protein
MKKLIFAGALALVATAAQAQSSGTGSNPNSHPVQRYTTSGGTYAAPQPQQTNPSTQTDNYGSRGSVSPDTGTGGTRNAR